MQHRPVQNVSQNGVEILLTGLACQSGAGGRWIWLARWWCPASRRASSPYNWEMLLKLAWHVNTELWIWAGVEATAMQQQTGKHTQWTHCRHLVQMKLGLFESMEPWDTGGTRLWSLRSTLRCQEIVWSGNIRHHKGGFLFTWLQKTRCN